jgi:hypothetical protein
MADGWTLADAASSRNAGASCFGEAARGRPCGRAALAVLGTGVALPGDPISTDQLLQHLAARFGVDVCRRGTALARLNWPLIPKLETPESAAQPASPMTPDPAHNP